MLARNERPPPAIGDHALIGDCRSAALVSGEGELDWLCWPRFDSPALFAGLLDQRRGGSWGLRPATPDFGATRRYLPGTAVLETRFATLDGVAAVLDFMPVASPEQKHRELWPEHQVLRRIECLEGEVELEVTFSPRPGFATRAFGFQDCGAAGYLIQLGQDVLAFRSDLELGLEEAEVRGRTRIRKGDVRWSSLSFARGRPAYIRLMAVGLSGYAIWRIVYFVSPVAYGLSAWYAVQILPSAAD